MAGGEAGKGGGGVNDRDMIPASGDPAETLRQYSPMRSDVVPTVALPQEPVDGIPEARAIAAEWALWGKEAHETGAHVLRCSNGALRAKDFAEIITRYAPGDLAVLPQYTMSWIPGADRQPEYVVIGIHELALADPRRPDGPHRRDAAGRAIAFVRLFCVRYSDAAELTASYQDIVGAAEQIQLPGASANPVTLTLPPEPTPVYSRGIPRKLAERVAALLLTNHPVCVLGADDVPAKDRLRFIDTVMALLPYGLRATMSGSTWVDSTAQDLKLRLFFASAPRAANRLADGRPTTRDRLVDWANTMDVPVTADAAAFYLDWLKDVKGEATDLLAEQSAAIRFNPADLLRMVGDLPRDMGIPETLDELGESLLKADKIAIKSAIKRLRRYLASGQPPAELTDYQRLVRAGQLFANDGRLSPQLKGELYGVLLPLAFGTPLTYRGYCAVEDCAGVPLHASLRTALTRARVDDLLAWILVRETRPGARVDKWLDELGRHRIPATAPLEALMNAVAAKQLRSAHGPIVLDFALRYLMKFSGRRPDGVLASHGYLASACQYIFHDTQEAQVSHLQWVLDIAFGAPLSRQAIDAVCAWPLTSALYKAVVGMTDRRDRTYLEEHVTAAARRSQGLPDRPVLVRQREQWKLRWPLGRRLRGGRGPMNEQSEFIQPLESPVDRISSRQPRAVALTVSGPQPQSTELRNSLRSTDSVWQQSKTTLGTIAIILVLCLIAYLMLQALLRLSTAPSSQAPAARWAERGRQVMPDMLTDDPGRADALVDLSNVLRNTALGGHGLADLVRLERVGKALAELYGAARTAMFGVADANLLAQRELFADPGQRRRLRDWKESRLILVAGKADIPLLQIAGETGLPIITGDRFVGHRREFPWLDGSDNAVLEPRAGRRGEVFLRHVTLEPKAEWDKSIREELDLLVQQGLSRRVEALGRYWSCPDPRCPRHDPVRGPFVLLPVARGGRLVCDQHGLEMRDLGPRPRVAQLKVMRDGRERHRFTVAEERSVIVGRSPEGIDLSPFLGEAERLRVSRRHLRFSVDAEQLTVTDMSRHGTVLILRDGTRRDLRRASRAFTVGDRAQVRPGLEIIRSGRRYPAELPGYGWDLPQPGGRLQETNLTL